jgi:hypothetical protein
LVRGGDELCNLDDVERYLDARIMSTGPRLSDDGQWWWTGAEWVRASQAPASPLAPIQTISESDSDLDASEAAPVSESVAAAPVSESVSPALQPAPTPNLLGLAVTNRFIFWAKIAAIIVYIPALIVEVIAASATPSGGNQPWYGNLAVAILLALALGGLLIDRRFFGSMGGIIKWNRMNGWQKGLVGFFYFLALLPLGAGIFYAVSLLPRRPEAFADVAAVPATLPDVSGSPPNWAPTPSSSLPRSQTFGGEQVIAVTRNRLGCSSWVIIILTLGIPLIWWAARTYTLTNTRVIVRHGIVWKSEQSIPLRNVTDVQITRGPLASIVVVLSAAGAISFGQITHGAAEQIGAAWATARGAA